MFLHLLPFPFRLHVPQGALSQKEPECRRFDASLADASREIEFTFNVLGRLRALPRFPSHAIDLLLSQMCPVLQEFDSMLRSCNVISRLDVLLAMYSVGPSRFRATHSSFCILAIPDDLEAAASSSLEDAGS